MLSIAVLGNDQDLSPMPIEPSWIRSGNPVACAKILSRSSDRASWTMLWECSPGAFEWHYQFDETIHFLDGQVTITLKGGQPQSFGAGDVIFFKKGDVAHWRVERHIRKLAVCHYPAPALMSRPLRLWRMLAFHGRKLLRQIRRDLTTPEPAAEQQTPPGQVSRPQA